MTSRSLQPKFHPRNCTCRKPTWYYLSICRKKPNYQPRNTINPPLHQYPRHNWVQKIALNSKTKDRTQNKHIYIACEPVTGNTYTYPQQKLPNNLALPQPLKQPLKLTQTPQEHITSSNPVPLPRVPIIPTNTHAQLLCQGKRAPCLTTRLAIDYICFPRLHNQSYQRVLPSNKARTRRCG